ncbi:YheC/YheD family endospore coat-associated protein [Alteribacillus bidgolensis]|uniref:YheC/D like ATP-grasp n=1 Tax=Alteribacillus bidgolensis TaxID=930129 RepID=A0A1G8HBI9_9BACI|nr:YheC/YheD family protein [Alteribacillus bidgolensis]SDI04027.1 YheC/D like ATP-grasp [Alteribacillus bidgolensis]
MSRKPLIGIMVNKRSKRKRTLRLYHQYKENTPVQLFSFTPKDINWKTKRIQGGCYINGKWETKTFRFPRAVYNRCYQRKGNTIKRLEKYIGKNKCFNTITFFNKWVVYKILSKSELNTYLPKTWFYKRKRFKKLLESRKHLILKPSYGFLGRRVYLVDTNSPNEPYKIYQDTLKRPKYSCQDSASFYKKIDELVGSKKFIIQELINTTRAAGRITDVRMLLQKNQNGKWNVTNGISRIAQKDYYVTNCSHRICEADEILQTLASNNKERTALYEEMRNTSLIAGELLEKHLGLLGEIGIDMVIDENRKIKIIEVNGKLQKNLYNKGNVSFSCNDLVYKRPVQFAYFLAAAAAQKKR